MKKTLFFLVPLILVSCQMADLTVDSYNKIALGNHEIYYTDFGDIQTEEDISWYIWDLIEYKMDYLNIIYSPEQTIKQGFGDCDEYALLFLNVAYVEWGEKYSIGCVDYKGRSIGSGGIYNHYIVGIDGRWFDPIEMLEYRRPEIKYYYTFEEVFNVN